MKKLLNKAEKIISKKYRSDDPNYGLLVLGCYALLSKYGEVYTPLVEEVMLKTKLVIGDKDLEELLAENKISPDEMFGDNPFSDDSLHVVAVSNPGLQMSFNKKGNLSLEKTTPCIFCSTIGNDNNMILQAFVHEANHIIKSRLNVVWKKDRNQLVLRSGLNLFGYHFEESGLAEESIYQMMDEVINVLQTADMTQAVAELDGEMMSPSVAKFFKDLDFESIGDIYGYEDVTEMVKPLWECEQFRTLVDDNAITGNVSKIVDEFDAVLGPGAFSDYASILEYADGHYENQEITDKITAWVAKTNELYRKKTSKEYKKEN